MTEENAKEYLINISYKLGTMGIECLTEKDGEKMREAIHALEQESVLDKIRTEIENHRRKTQYIDPYDLIGDCLDIIDKCIESEEKG
jgi:hypothetical protein